MNKHNNILLVDPKFDPVMAKSCSLLIKAAADSFSYAIINNTTKQVIAVFDEQECDGAQKLADYLKIDNYLSLPYQEIKLAFYTENYISVPNELYNENDLGIHTQFFIAPHTNNLYTHKQAHFEYVNVFTLGKIADETSLNYFADGKKYIDNSGLVKIAENIKENALIIDFSNNGCIAIYVANEKLIFQQSYEISNTEELNYFLLLMIDKLNIDSVNTKLLLCGIIHQEDKNYHCLQKYFSSISFLTLENELDLKVIDDLPFHYYSSLLALSLCE